MQLDAFARSPVKDPASGAAGALGRQGLRDIALVLHGNKGYWELNSSGIVLVRD